MKKLKDELLIELHKYLKILIPLIHKKHNGEAAFINGFLLNASFCEYGQAEYWIADRAVENYEAFNDELPENLGIIFVEVIFDDDLELTYIFNLYINEDNYFDHEVLVHFKDSENKLLLDKKSNTAFNKIFTKDVIEERLQIVKRELSFGPYRIAMQLSE